MKKKTISIIAALVLVVAVGAYWSTGSADTALAPLSLNANECARNDYGTFYCGEELDAKRAEEARAEEQVEEDETAAEPYGGWGSEDTCIAMEPVESAYLTCTP